MYSRVNGTGAPARSSAFHRRETSPRLSPPQVPRNTRTVAPGGTSTSALAAAASGSAPSRATFHLGSASTTARVMSPAAGSSSGLDGVGAVDVAVLGVGGDDTTGGVALPQA